ncbi:unnamed protein product [Mesocestoides corti]|uniref:PDZ domain-containing protein n=1 Tax=Mesocestoides corti TaxID=53468 RepID=A0A0R3UK36_MESCO|nr:unnamed protein product [Mesocestoides corti]
MPHPRLCCLRIDEEYSGFGFSLVATKNETGQFIDEVRSGSPAARAGLKDGDFVVEVNGENILSLSHSEVVELIRKNPNEVSFLVLDPVSRRHYDECSVVVHGQLPEVQRICSWSDTSCTSPKVSGNNLALKCSLLNRNMPPPHLAILTFYILSSLFMFYNLYIIIFLEL